MPTINLRASSNHHNNNHYHHPRHYHEYPPTYHYRITPAALVTFLLVVAVFIGCALIASSVTVSLTASSLTGSSLLTTAVIGIGASSLAMGIGGLAYIIAGVAGAVYAGIQTYQNPKSWQEALKDVVFCNRYLDDKRSLKSIATAVAVVIVSPFLLIGGLSGLGVKACVNAYQHQQTQPLDKTEDIQGSYSRSALQNVLTTPNPYPKAENKNPPVHQPVSRTRLQAATSKASSDDQKKYNNTLKL